MTYQTILAEIVIFKICTMSYHRDNKDIDENIVKELKNMLDGNNVHAKAFRMARDVLKDGPVQDVRLKLISDRNTDGRIYNKPTISEVSALIVCDIDSTEKRDIIIQRQSGQLQRIDEFHASYLGFQYPLLFPYGEDGYRLGILHRYKNVIVVTKENKLTIKAWFHFRLMTRKFEAMTLLCSRRLFQQFLVDRYTMMESERLNWLRRNQSKLRVGKYRQLIYHNSVPKPRYHARKKGCSTFNFYWKQKIHGSIILRWYDNIKCYWFSRSFYNIYMQS